MEKELRPNISGYICNWLVSGPQLTTPEVDFFDQNQLAFEKRLRSVIADGSLQAPPSEIAMGKDGLPGHPWEYYVAGNNWFIDVSTFYRLLTKVELYAYTEILSDAERTVQGKLRTFTAVDMWLGEEKVAHIGAPVYKPIHNEDFTLHLKKGKNPLFLRVQDLGVRDTRTIVGVQLLGNLAGLTITLPDPDGTVAPVIAAERWLGSVTYADGCLRAESAPPCPVRVVVSGKVAGHEEAVGEIAADELHWQAGDTLSVNSKAQGIDLYAEVSGEQLHRDLELIHNIHPEMSDDAGASIEEHRRNVIRALAEIPTNHANGGVNYSSYHVLARYILGANTPEDIELLMGDFELIYKRIDCADFLLSCMLRLFNRFPVPEQRLRERMKEVCLDFRYWMDEKGSDGMCFWSENHALLFFGNQMLAGKMFPDEVFTRSGRTGREQYELGAERCREWLDSVDDTGFEEFLSGGYMCVTSDALLNCIDFGPEDVSAKATKVLDKLLRQLSMHTFKGAVCGPQGRVYRDVIYPFKQGVQSLMHYITPTVPKGLSMWTSAFGCTGYQIPDDLTSLMQSPADETYPCGNGEITIKKTADYILTSVASPKKGAKGWSNAAYTESDPYKTGKFTYMYTKALNERFHGTTLFEPGVYGYQQHMWYATLSPTCTVFSNHPGGTHDHSSMRPGYWYGNGLMPAIRQEGNCIGVIYHLREEHPVTFTHLYWPSQEFDEVKGDGGWLFGRLGDSYVAVWCNTPYTPHNDVLIDRELRAYAEKVAYLCICSSKAEAGSFEGFIDAMQKKVPVFDPETLTLRTSDGYSLTFVEKHNDSQYI